MTPSTEKHQIKGWHMSTNDTSIGEFMNQLIDFQAELDENANEKKAINERLKEMLALAKASGVDTAIMKKTLAAIKKGVDEYDEEVTMVDLYLTAAGKK
jgi:uncharacterized protein (UPF0335 family)